MAMEQIYIEGGVALNGELEVSGSKNSALALMNVAILADGPVRLKRVPQLADIETMGDLLRRLGAACERDGTDLLIDGANVNVDEAPYDVVRKMRASIYVLGALLARLGHARVSLPGGCAIGPRPVDLHIRGLEKLGVKINLEHGFINADGSRMRPADVYIAGPNGSSVGATVNVLMAAAAIAGRTTLRGCAMEPEVTDLVNLINAMGGKIDGAGGETLIVEGGRTLRGCEYRVIPDRIEAGTFLVSAAITGGAITLTNADSDAMTATLDTLREIGFPVDADPARRTIRLGAVREKMRPVSITTRPYPGFPTDMQAQFTALLATVAGESRVEETVYVDRFIHVSELMRMGAKIRLEPGAVRISGVESLSGAPVMASDLRASAALVIAGLKATGTTRILRVYHIDRGYEQIDAKLRQLGARIRRSAQ